MSESATAYLVAKRDDGFGDVVPLSSTLRLTVGRGATHKVVLRDDLCSRDHAELFRERDSWVVRDTKSLNGTHVNGRKIDRDFRLAPGDEVRFGRSIFLFLDTLDQLPAPPSQAATVDEAPDGLEITRRLGKTKYLEPPGLPSTPNQTAIVRPSHADALASLYRLALDMATAPTWTELGNLAVTALLAATPARVGAVLARKGTSDFEPVAYTAHGSAPETYHKVSAFVTREVLSSRQGVLAENVAAHAAFRNRDSLAELRVSSLICAPILAGDDFLGVLHLYATGSGPQLVQEDLHFALAVAGQLGQAWDRVRKQAGLAAENRTLKDQLKVESELVGESPALRTVLDQVARVAGTTATVLVRGESGVGKELVARAVHRSSPRKDAPFVCLNCAALTETLLESELFGHEKGAFTGATDRMIGKFEAADQGTIFLDEIGEMALSTQAKFLRVLEGQPFERVGGNTAIRADVRVVAATNSPLEQSVKNGTFRKDLFYRLQVVQLDVPSLRSRPEDVPPLAEHFLKRYAREFGRKVKGFTPNATEKLTNHPWPGNVRELRNVIERAVALCTASTIDADDLWLGTSTPPKPLPTGGAYEAVPLEEVEKRHILLTLTHTEWNKSRAAELLGIERSTLDRKIKGYGLSK